jgi:hypothetical protein
MYVAIMGRNASLVWSLQVDIAALLTVHIERFMLLAGLVSCDVCTVRGVFQSALQDNGSDVLSNHK